MKTNKGGHREVFMRVLHQLHLPVVEFDVDEIPEVILEEARNGPVKWNGLEIMSIDGVYDAVTETDLSVFIKKTVERRRIKAIASDMGLAYWPALHVTGVDPKAYLAAEKAVLSHKHGLYRFTASGKRENGGWDANNRQGISAWKVMEYWKASGCKDTSKFRWLVRNYRLVRYLASRGVNLASKGIRYSELKLIARGATTFQKMSNINIRVSPKVFKALGRLSPDLRWAAMSAVLETHVSTSPLRVRDLNWTAVDAVQKGLVCKDHYVPVEKRNFTNWYKAFRPLLPSIIKARNLRDWWVASGCLNIRDCGVSPQRVVNLAGVIAKHSPMGHYNASFILGGITANSFLPAFALSRLFGKNDTALSSYLARTTLTLHDAGQLQLPYERFSVAWGGFIAAKPSLARCSRHLYKAEQHLGRPPHTLSEAVTALAAVAPPSWTYELEQLSARERSAYLKLIPEVKTWEAIPAPYVESGKYVLTQLAVGDIRAPMIGLLTGCCQHLHGAAASCAALSYTSPYVAVWAVFKGDVIIAQALVWKSKNVRSLVLDSVESLGDVRNNPVIAKMFITASRQVVGKLGVCEVLLSLTDYGMTPLVNTLIRMDSAFTSCCAPAVDLGYSDATDHLLVVAKTNPSTVVDGLPPQEKTETKCWTMLSTLRAVARPQIFN